MSSCCMDWRVSTACVLVPVWKARCSTDSIETAELSFLSFPGDEEPQIFNNPLPTDMSLSLREPTISAPLATFLPLLSLATAPQIEIQNDLALPKPKRCGRCGIY